MKTTVTKANGLYEALRDNLKGEPQSGKDGHNTDEPIALDDTERVKVLSPGRLVAKRFFRNKLAMVGLVVLIVMFLFAFAGAIVYPFSQTQIFYKYDYLNIDYASATERTENTIFKIPGGPEVQSTIANSFNSYIKELEADGAVEKAFEGTDGVEYIVTKLGDKVFTLSTAKLIPLGTYRPSGQVATYNKMMELFEWTGGQLDDEFQNAAILAINDGASEFEFRGVSYSIAGARNRAVVTRIEPEFSGAFPGYGFMETVEENLEGGDFEFDGEFYRVTGSGGAFTVSQLGDIDAALIASTFVFNAHEPGRVFSEEFRRNAVAAIYGDGVFMADGEYYSIRAIDGDRFIDDASGIGVAELSSYSIRRYSGQDTLSIDFKLTTQHVIEELLESNAITATFVYGVHEIDTSGNYVFDDDGEPVYVDSEITVTRKNTGEFVLTCEQITYLIDIFAPPTRGHSFGTDGDGMDILARMMYGGRISLMVGFVVVILEIILGVIMGGVSGFFGGWVDTLIMRVADIFYCVPTYPILIILGALFDKLKMDPYRRLIWLMATLGILGWALVARIVRGQILSLREQEFMIAQEATGMRARRRIFRHLVPNVMPQLIVRATMGVGEVIIYESTLSFLGLGVKHPLATWGTMINSVTSSVESMIRYTYIWIPVGLLICLTVIAFNFVGDGLRDAFDPKMRR